MNLPECVEPSSCGLWRSDFGRSPAPSWKVRVGRRLRGAGRHELAKLRGARPVWRRLGGFSQLAAWSCATLSKIAFGQRGQSMSPARSPRRAQTDSCCKQMDIFARAGLPRLTDISRAFCPLRRQMRGQCNCKRMHGRRILWQSRPQRGGGGRASVLRVLVE